MGVTFSEMLREIHGDLQRKWRVHGSKVETAWRSFNKAQRARCMKATELKGQPLKHSRDPSLGSLCKFTPEWNLDNITDPDSNLFLDILKHRASTSLSMQVRSGHNGTAGDLDIIDEMTRARGLRLVDECKNYFTAFDEWQYGSRFRVHAGYNDMEVLSELKSAFHVRYIIPESLGLPILKRQLHLLQVLNIMIVEVLHQGSKTRDRSQPAKNSKPPTAPLSDSVAKQATVKLNPQELFAVVSDQKSSLEEYSSLLCTEPTVLCADVNAQFFSRPELVPDEKGQSLPVHTDKYVGPAVFEAIHHAIQAIAIWESITDLLNLLEQPSTVKLYKSTILQELSNMCHFEYTRTQALFKRQVSTGTGSKWFRRLSNVYGHSGNVKVSIKGKPEELTRSNPQLHYLLRLCQPETTVTKAVDWMQKLSDLYRAHPLERERLQQRESRTLYNMAAIIAFVQDLSAVYVLPSPSRKKGNVLVSALQEVGADLDLIKREVDLCDYAAPIDNLLEPGVSPKALEALDKFVKGRTRTTMGSMYQDELNKAFRDIEKQYQQVKQKSKKDTKVEFVPIDTTTLDVKNRITTQKQKAKTRPEHSSVYANTPITVSPDEKEPAKAAQPVKVSPSTAEVFATLFNKTQSRGSVSWSSFEAAMYELGFSVLPRFGSVYTFRPSEDMDIKRPFSIHRPHQSQIEGYLTLILARRLNRAYGWSEESFVTE
ncbi:Ipa [Fusarium napiforme]|uniref:Ipa n=1 Tax=Fusarium napiforme TaxID=42672 RepID=A0A8H5NA23_9HYPO|nr:Ipa [Fusarium napiforme]